MRHRNVGVTFVRCRRCAHVTSNLCIGLFSHGTAQKLQNLLLTAEVAHPSEIKELLVHSSHHPTLDLKLMHFLTCSLCLFSCVFKSIVITSSRPTKNVTSKCFTFSGVLYLFRVANYEHHYMCSQTQLITKDIEGRS